MTGDNIQEHLYNKAKDSDFQMALADRLPRPPEKGFSALRSQKIILQEIPPFSKNEKGHLIDQK